MADRVCDWVINVQRLRCGRRAVAVIHPPAGVTDDPLPVCAGHLAEHKRWGGHTKETPRG